MEPRNTSDEERKPVSSTSAQDSDQAEQSVAADAKTSIWATYSVYIQLGGWLIFTGWWIAGLILHHRDKGWIVPFLLWLSLTLRVFWTLLPTAGGWKSVQWIWTHTTVRIVSCIPPKLRLPVVAIFVIAVILIGAFTISESEQNSREDRAIALLGYVTLVFMLWATSHNRRKVNWQTILVGILVQFTLALFVLRTTAGYDMFHFVSTLAGDLLGFASTGVAFLTDTSVTKLGWFLVAVVPPIIFFIALIQILYHYRFISWFIGKFAVFFRWSMDVSGAEAVAAAASPFIGQGENAVLIQPFITYLTNAEIHQVMCSGFGTIAGSVLGAYIGLGISPQVLVSSCVMSVPASLAFSHLRYPEEEESMTRGRVTIPSNDDRKSTNVLHALAKGAWLGLKVAGMVIANLLCIVSILSLVNAILTWLGSYVNLDGQYDLTIDLIVGYLCYPIAFLLGVHRDHELLLVGRLIGIKIVTNEFVAYTTLVSKAEYMAMSMRSRRIASYALCGFGNLAALGTQIGVLSQLAPARAGDVSKVAVSALFTGVISTLSSACVAGMLIEE